MQTSLFFVAIAALARVALSDTPPACLIAALGAQTNPADISYLCQSGLNDFYGNITEKCSGDNKASAESIYSATCLDSGVTISLPTSTAATSPTGTGSGTGSGGPATQTDASTTGTEDAPSATPTNAGSSLSAFSGIILGSAVVLTSLASQFFL